MRIANLNEPLQPEPNQRVLPPAVLALLRIAEVEPNTLWTHLANSDSSSR